MEQVVLPNAGGVDYIVEAVQDPDDTMRWKRRGDVYPRVMIDPWNGSVRVGSGSASPSSLIGAAPAQYRVTDFQVYPTSDPRYSSAISNTFAFAILEASVAGTADFIFPPGDYPTFGFAITKTGHRIIGAGGRAGNNGGGTRFYLQGSGNCIAISGDDGTGGYGDRLMGVGVIGVYMENQGTGTNLALRIKHCSLSVFEDCYSIGFRGDGGGVYAYNFADSYFIDCAWEYCGSADQTDKAAIKFTGTVDGGETPRWAVDAIRFIECRWENCSDRLLDFREDNGFQVNKIFFFGCKFENSVSGGNGLNGSAGANQAQIWLDNCSHIVFNTCDFTLQNLASGAPSPLGTIFRTKNYTTLHLIGVQFHCGAIGPVKAFTNYIVADHDGTVVVLDDVWVNSGNAAAFPTTVLAATNTPNLAQRNVGFTPFLGSGKVAADWFTAADWHGVHAGAPATNGVIA